MIILDLNLLIYAVDEDSPFNPQARNWLESVLSGDEVIGLAWNVIPGFLRLTTRPAVFARPLPIRSAFDIVDLWLEQTQAQIVHPGPRHRTIMRALLEPIGTGGNLTSDAHLAALAIERDAVLCSTDLDFARFKQLIWRNPLEQKAR